MPIAFWRTVYTTDSKQGRSFDFEDALRFVSVNEFTCN